MGRVRVKLNFVFEWDGEGIPREFAMLDKVDRFITAGLDDIGVAGNGKSVTLLPGARVEIGTAKTPKPRAVKP